MTDTEIETLSSDDSALLLHLAGELSDGERVALDRRLANDATLRGRLAVMAALDSQMRGESHSKPISAADSRRALNASLRLVREQALLLQSRPVGQVRSRRLAGIPGWAWGSAVAACVAVGVVVWISNSDPSPVPGEKQVAKTDDRGNDDGRGLWGVTAAFSPVESASNDGPPSSTANEIDNQIDALNTLAVMNDAN